MKTLKISLVIIAIAAVAGYFLWKWVVIPPPPPPPPSVANEWEKKIRDKIDSLNQHSAAKFCPAFYTEIKNNIPEFEEAGKIDNKTATDLAKNLDYAYFDKFIAQAFHVFRGSEWQPSDRSFIDTETEKLQKSKFLDPVSNVNKKLIEILDILQTYNKVDSFIQSVDSYVKRGAFSLEKSKAYLFSIQQYKSDGLGQYVNNCTSLHDALKDLPEKLYTKHLNYVKQSINANRNAYRNTSFSGVNWAQKTNDYKNKIYFPVIAIINELETEKNIYNVSTINSDLSALKDIWEKELADATEYFKN